MYIILDKPSLSFKKQTEELPGKQITIYTNELEKVSKTGITKHLIINNKLLALNSKLAYVNNELNEIERQRFSHFIYLKTAHFKPNIIVDMLLEKDEDLYNFKVQYPIILEFFTKDFSEVINSLTYSLTLENNFDILNKIGEGSFAQIFLAREQATGYLRSIKVLNKQRCAKLGQLSYITNEISVLKEVPSKWHIQLFYVFEDEQNVNLVTEYCPYGDLFTEIQRNHRTMTSLTKYTYFIQLCFQVCRLHQNGYLYRDLKPENVLIDYKGNIKLCDFGYAIKTKPGQIFHQICGSYEYLPPQMVNKQGYNHSHDVYCLGLLFYEMLTGQNPFKGITSKNVQEINGRKIEFQKSEIQPQTKDLLMKLLEKDPKKRLGSQSSLDIFRHPFFKENSEIIIKIIKDEKINSPETTNIKIKNLGPRKKSQEQQGQMAKNKIKIPLLLSGKIYNYLTPSFNITEKMGPKIIPSDDKNKKNNE